MPATPTTLGTRVALRRAQLGLTQRALAELCGCTVMTISDIECDRRVGGISQRMLAELKKHLDISVDELIGGKRVKNAGSS
jgi:transcriptional regulator with XRE-family HTH domain